MYKLIIVSVFFMCRAISGLSQNNAQIIEINGDYYVNNKELNRKELKSILLSDSESALEYRKAENYSTIGLLTGLSGIVLMTYGEIVMDNAAYDKANYGETTNSATYYVPLVAGVGLGLASVYYYISSVGHSKKNSITIYNSKRTTTGFRNELKMDIGITQNGIGVFYKF